MKALWYCRIKFSSNYNKYNVCVFDEDFVRAVLYIANIESASSGRTKQIKIPWTRSSSFSFGDILWMLARCLDVCINTQVYMLVKAPRQLYLWRRQKHATEHFIYFLLLRVYGWIYVPIVQCRIWVYMENISVYVIL